MDSHELISLVIFLAVLVSIYSVEVWLIARGILRAVRGAPDFRSFLHPPALAVHVLAFIGVVSLWYGIFIEPYWIEVKRVDIETDKLTRARIRIVQISDLHSDRKVRNERKLPLLINALAPDSIVFTGDALNSASALPVFKETLRALQAPLGKYAVRGNVDDWFWKDIDLFGNTGFTVLDKQSVALSKDGDTFYISGVDFKRPDRAFKILRNVPAGRYSIFLYHTSRLIHSLKGLNVDLYLSGHTHGGQVALPFYGALVTRSKYSKRYESGKYSVGETILYVNRGIGMQGGWAPRIRFFARPEITVFDIHPKSTPTS